MTPLTPDQQAALEKLRDIRLPDPVSWWPLAPGWWALAALVLAAVAALLGWSLLRRRTRRYAALRELDGLKRRVAAGADAGVAQELAGLVRRVALAARGAAVAPLTDRAWIEALAEGPAGLPKEVATLLADAPYRPAASFDRSQLARLFAPVEAWIRRTA